MQQGYDSGTDHKPIDKAVRPNERSKGVYCKRKKDKWMRYSQTQLLTACDLARIGANDQAILNAIQPTLKPKLHIIVTGGNPTTREQAERVRVKYKRAYGSGVSIRMHRDKCLSDLDGLRGGKIIVEIC